MNALVRDRTEGGRLLAQQLRHRKAERDWVVLGLPRGGVPVGSEVANELDVFLVRKLGVPGFEEFAFGAIASGGIQLIDQEITNRLGITPRMIEAVIAEQQKELERRERAYRAGREPQPIADRAVILVDDGLATGASMRVAVRAVRAKQPSSVTVAVPIGAPETCDAFRAEADEVICGRTPEPFGGVGRWYDDFRQTTDEEVIRILDHQAHLQKVRRVRREHEQEETAILKNHA